jgi:hypothetical protein
MLRDMTLTLPGWAAWAMVGATKAARPAAINATVAVRGRMESLRWFNGSPLENACVRLLTSL